MPPTAHALHSMKCAPCRSDAPPLTDPEIEALRAQTPGWEIERVEGVPRLTRGFLFDTVDGLIAFQGRVMELSDAEGHHPVMRVSARKRGWKLTVDLWTHKLDGLHQNDFIMAAKFDLLSAEGGTGDSP